MGSKGTVSLKDIWAMLDKCAPGAAVVEKTHHWRVTVGDRVYPTLPKGAHGKRHNPGIEVGHVRRMARHLDILDCAKEQIELL
jgi:hypothetical protein